MGQGCEEEHAEEVAAGHGTAGRRARALGRNARGPEWRSALPTGADLLASYVVHGLTVSTRDRPAHRPAWVARVWQRVAEEAGKGHQAFVVCARIGDEEAADAVDDMAAEDAPDLDAEQSRRPIA